MRAINVREKATRRTATLAIKLLIVVLLTISLSGPYLVKSKVLEEEVTGEVRQLLKVGRPVVMICIDVSGSMADTMPGGVKIDVAKQVIAKFLSELPGNVSVGLIAFSHSIVAEVPPTQDRERVKAALNGLRAEGGTMYTYPLSTALNYLKAYRILNVSTMLIFVTDGVPADPEYRSLLDDFVEWRIPIYTVYIGAGQGVEETELMASRTGGKTFTAGSADKLRDVFRSLTKEAGKLKVKVQARLKLRKEIRVKEPISWVLLGISAALFTILSLIRYKLSKLTP